MKGFFPVYTSSSVTLCNTLFGTKIPAYIVVATDYVILDVSYAPCTLDQYPVIFLSDPILFKSVQSSRCLVILNCLKIATNSFEVNSSLLLLCRTLMCQPIHLLTNALNSWN
jgi:hypothetical protein